MIADYCRAQGTPQNQSRVYSHLTVSPIVSLKTTEVLLLTFLPAADYLADFAVQNNKVLRCHNLLWHSQLPDWVSAITDNATLVDALQNHISNVAGHFAGKCYAWDVVNEIFGEDGTLESNVFLDVIGDGEHEDALTIVFRRRILMCLRTRLRLRPHCLRSCKEGRPIR